MWILALALVTIGCELKFLIWCSLSSGQNSLGETTSWGVVGKFDAMERISDQDMWMGSSILSMWGWLDETETSWWIGERRISLGESGEEDEIGLSKGDVGETTLGTMKSMLQKHILE